MNNFSLENYLDQLLSSATIQDYSPNGLQIEGRSEVKSIVCGVTASQALIDSAVEQGTDAIFVHHGYFWKGENPQIKGMKKKRIQTLLRNDINLYSYHLPLDVHPELGNNAQLAALLDIEVTGDAEVKPAGVLKKGKLACAQSAQAFADKMSARLNRSVLLESVGDKPVNTLAWCSGGGQNFIEQAVSEGVDLFFTGEVSEQTIHIAREAGIHFIAAGHHATERYGAKAIAEHLAEHCGLDACFIDIDNPA